MSKRSFGIRLISIVTCALLGAAISRNLVRALPEYSYTYDRFLYTVREDALTKETWRLFLFVIAGAVVGATIGSCVSRSLIELPTRKCVDVLAVVCFVVLMLFCVCPVLVPPWAGP